MKIINYCRHRTAGWEGIVYRDDRGAVYITNGLGCWEMSEKRQSDLETVEQIDLAKVRDYLEQYEPNSKLLRLLAKNSA